MDERSLEDRHDRVPRHTWQGHHREESPQALFGMPFRVTSVVQRGEQAQCYEQVDRGFIGPGSRALFQLDVRSVLLWNAYLGVSHS